ncbi:MAG: hypothetical protein J5767_12580 [Paludibacteraceae bacterium]|nr:hypothetical protein [Paludibacteraceae bacterium]
MKRLIYNSQYLYTLEDYNEYLHCIESNEPEKEEEDDEFYSWVSDQLQRDSDDFWKNLKFCRYNLPCYVRGFLGLWDGKHEIERKDFNDLESAMIACFNGCDGASVYSDGNGVYVDAYHHDGRNHFKITIKGKKLKGGYLW